MLAGSVRVVPAERVEVPSDDSDDSVEGLVRDKIPALSSGKRPSEGSRAGHP